MRTMRSTITGQAVVQPVGINIYIRISIILFHIVRVCSADTCNSGVTRGTGEAGGTLNSLRTRGTLNSLGSIGALDSLRTFNTLNTLGAGGTLDSLCTFSALNSLGPISTLGTSLADPTLWALDITGIYKATDGTGG